MHEPRRRMTSTSRPGRLVQSAIAGVVAATLLGLGADQALASYTVAVDAGGTLRVDGDNASDKLLLVADTTTLFIDVGTDGTIDFTLPRSSFNDILVRANGGDDEVRVQGQPLTGLTIDGGNGDDTLLGGAGTESFLGGNGNDFIDGNIGADTVLGGPGNDPGQWDPGDGSDVVDGQGNNDTLAFNGSNIGEDIAIFATGTTFRLTRNVASINMDLQGLETVNVRTLAGADNVIAQGTDSGDTFKLGSEGTTAVVDGPYVDVRTTGAEPADVVGAAGLGGDDVFTMSA